MTDTVLSQHAQLLSRLNSNRFNHTTKDLDIRIDGSGGSDVGSDVGVSVGDISTSSNEDSRRMFDFECFSVQKVCWQKYIFSYMNILCTL